MDLFSLVAKLTLDSNEFSKGIDKAEQELQSLDVDEPKLGLDNSEFNDNIAESEGMGDQFGTNMGGVFEGIKSALTTTGIVAAIAGIVKGLKEAIDMTAATADGIDKGSRKLGISTDAYQKWDHALRQSGSSIQDVKKGIINFQTALKAADPATPFADAEDQVDGLADKTAGLSQEAYNAMRDLGLLERLQAGEFKNAEEMMNAALLALADYDGSKEDRGILVRALFGRGGDDLNALLDSGKDGVQALLNEAEDLGLIMSEDEINNAVAYGDAVANLNAELDAIKQAFVAEIIPKLSEAVGWVTDFLKKINPRNRTMQVFKVIEDINGRALLASQNATAAEQEAISLIGKLEELGDYWTLDEEGKMTWDALASRAVELFPELSQWIDTDGKKIRGNTDEIIANIKAWSLLEKQRILATAMEEKRTAVAEAWSVAFAKGAEAAKKESEAEGARAAAIAKLNEMLVENGKKTISVTATSAEIDAAINSMTEGMNEEDAGVIQEQAWVLFKNWGEIWTEAAKLREESDKLKENAQKAQDDLADDQRYLMKEMGYTEESIKEETEAVQRYIDQLNKTPSDVYTTFHTEFADGEDAHPKAIGGMIPYDNYPALLHRGERVLTATEVRNGAGGSGVDYTEMENRIIAAIRAGMDGATVRSYLNGRDITDEVNRENMRGVKGRRFST